MNGQPRQNPMGGGGPRPNPMGGGAPNPMGGPGPRPNPMGGPQPRKAPPGGGPGPRPNPMGGGNPSLGGGGPPSTAGMGGPIPPGMGGPPPGVDGPRPRTGPGGQRPPGQFGNQGNMGGQEPEVPQENIKEKREEAVLGVVTNILTAIEEVPEVLGRVDKRIFTQYLLAMTVILTLVAITGRKLTSASLVHFIPDKTGIILIILNFVLMLIAIRESDPRMEEYDNSDEEYEDFGDDTYKEEEEEEEDIKLAEEDEPVKDMLRDFSRVPWSPREEEDIFNTNPTLTGNDLEEEDDNDDEDEEDSAIELNFGKSLDLGFEYGEEVFGVEEDDSVDIDSLTMGFLKEEPRDEGFETLHKLDQMTHAAGTMEDSLGESQVEINKMEGDIADLLGELTE